MTVSRKIHGLLIAFVAAGTGIAAVSLLWRAWCEFPMYSWNEARLAPAFALRDGINPYPPIGGGPLFTWIYGPVGILINLPATFTTSAIGALHVASQINFLVLIIPLALIFFGSEDLKKCGASIRWFALTVAILLIPRPNLVFQVADHAAIAFGLLSCWWLSRNARPDNRQLGISALFCTLAIWSKQITVFIPVAQIIYLFLTNDRSAALKYLVWAGLFNLATLGLAVWAFGWANLWLNLVAIPGRLPWADDIGARFATRSWPLVAQIGLPCIALILLRITKMWPDKSSESGRFLLITVLAFFAMLPMGLAAFLKIGGDTNLFHSWDYLLPGLLIAWLVAEKNHAVGLYRMLAVAGCAIALRWTDIISLPSRPFIASLESAQQLAAKYPGRIWFPRNPIITYYTDGSLWHTEDGVETRFLAHYGIREADFRRHLPSHMDGIAYPSSMDQPFSLSLLSEFDQTVKQPFWTLYIRSTPSPSKAQK
jgi:hypothetical protein